QDYEILEARDRFGGRILTERREDGGYFDMGPAWFWPGQPRIAALIARLGLKKFDQYAVGELLFEDEDGRVNRGRGFASMEGSWRLDGGLGALTQELAGRIPAERKRLNANAVSIEKTQAVCGAVMEDGAMIEAEHVVLAMPPRIMATIKFDPPLPDRAIQAMNTVPTWMAGQAKAMAVYDTPFWRNLGLSGDAMSRRGPMGEIHDASALNGGGYALFGFIGIPPKARSNEQGLRQAIVAQLVRMFGSEAAEPRALMIKDWAFDPLTATDADAAPVYSHPAYGLPDGLNDLWDGDLVLAGTEVAQSYGGFIEGALEAAEAAHKKLASHRSAA
ncbi:MAG: NAD(P)/FAD-dependent oxidoreductase, partial [Pseudomonadota bacterium]